MKAIYLDHNATSPMRSCARERWLTLSREAWANARSLHGPGVVARRTLETVREELAGALGARPSEIVFTSGATESNHSAIRSLTTELQARGPVRWAIGAGEHPSAFLALGELVKEGRATQRIVRLLPSGQIDLSDLEEALERSDALCLQVANHETGALTDLHAVSALVEPYGVPWHADAVQAIGRTPFRLDDHSARMVTSASISGHKLGGPGGVGLLLWRAGRDFHPLMPDTGDRARAGTPDVPGIGAMCAALQESLSELDGGLMVETRSLRDSIETALCEGFPGAIVHGAQGARLDNTLSISVPCPGGAWPDGEQLVLELATRGLELSTGAACATGTGEPSRVLIAMGCSAEVAAASLRLSLGHETKLSDLNRLLSTVRESMAQLDDH